MLAVKNISTFVPVDRVPLTELSGSLSLSTGALSVLRRIYGLENIAKCTMSYESLLETTIRDLLIRSRVDPGGIGLLICTHTAYEIAPYPNPILAQIARRLGLCNAHPFGIHSNNCASFMTALDVAGNYISTLPDNSGAIIVTADLTFTDIMRQIPGTTVCGDAAAACLVGADHPDSGTRMLSLEISTFGAHAKGMWQDRENQALFEDQYPPRLASTMRRGLKAAGLEWRDIKWVFPHNINFLSWKKVAAAADLPAEKLFLRNIPNLGHCFGADVLLNWSAAMDKSELSDGDHFMLATVGLGAVFASAVFQYRGSPK